MKATDQNHPDKKPLPRGRPHMNQITRPLGIPNRFSQISFRSKATMSQLYNADQDYSPEILKDAARALSAEPWELLMPPERAMQIRRVFAELSRVADAAGIPGTQVSDKLDHLSIKALLPANPD